MKKLSVIIPTILKKPIVLNKLLGILDKDKSVDEIIIINNSGIKKSEWLTTKSEKIEVITKKKNLYVNASWNFGVSKARNEDFLLLNDDLLIPNDFCKKVVNSEVYNDSDTGLVGMAGKYINFYNAADTDDLEIPKIAKDDLPGFLPLFRYTFTGDWGIAIFGKKENYYEIPDDFKIIYGDNYMLKKNLDNKKNNYEIVNLPVNHIHSSSSISPEFSDIVASDINNWETKYEKKEQNKGEETDMKTVTEPIKKKSLPKYQINYSGEVCIIKHENDAMCLKYKNNGKILTEQNFLKMISELSKTMDEKAFQKIYKEIKTHEKELKCTTV